MKKVISRLAILAVLGAAGWGGYHYYKMLPERQDSIPTTRVQKSDVVIRAFSRGELHAIRVEPLFAPNLNGTVQVTSLAPIGALARQKDLVIEYDDSERLAALEEARLEIQSVDENIKKARTDLSIQESQDQVALLKAKFDVRRAELEVKKNDLIDVIEAKKNVLQLDQSRRALQQLETDIAARKEQADSQLNVYLQQRNRANQQVQQELRRLADTRMLSPITGLVSIRQNRGGFVNFGQQLPEIREGDTLQPGMPVADILDLSELEVWTKIGELDRANLREGQDALLQLDAIPDKRFNGKIKAMSGTATSDVYSGDPSKKFDVIFAIDMRQLLTGLGMKPADIDRIMATAAENSKRSSSSSGANFFAGLQADMAGRGGAGGSGGPDAQQSQGQAQGQAQGGGRGARGEGGEGRGGRTGSGGRAVGGRMPEESRKLVNDLLAKAAGAPKEERQKLMQQVQDVMQSAGLNIKAPLGGREGGRGGRRGEFAGGGRRSGGEGGGRRGGEGGEGGRGAFPGGANPFEMTARRGGQQFTEEERTNAKLPLPPEQDSQVQTLLRPGLLADVEIIVEKIPDALHVPAQAVFAKGGKPTVFVRQANGKFEPHEVQLLKRSESTMVLAGGVRPNDVIAMMDPTVDRSTKKNKAEKESSGTANPMGGMPGGK
jgi:HlyD family secretion protein